MKKTEEVEEYEPSYDGIDRDPDTLFKARYIDSLFGTTLFLRRDGRRRGLWVWLEEDHKARIRQDTRIFEEGLKKFTAWLEAPDGYKEKPEMLGFMLRSIHFDYFFGHRTEGSAVRLTWPQLRKFIKAAKDAEKAETRKTEDRESEEES